MLPLLDSFTYAEIPARTQLLRAGQVASEIYLLLEGCLRLYYEKDGKDISGYFFTEGMFSGSYDSFITQTPSVHFIETIEPCKLLRIGYADFQSILAQHPNMNLFVRKILEERFIDLHQHFTSHILESPEERYLWLMQHRPALLERVPQHQLATFLGVTPVSLSRIRNRIMRAGK